MAVNNRLCGSIEALTWENKFFGISSAILHVHDNAPNLCRDNFQEWKLIQTKIPADRTDWIDILQQNGFRLVEGEINFSIPISQYEAPTGAEIATESDITELKLLAAKIFSKSRFRFPWYTEKDRSRFYAQWIENAVKGTFDHQCLVFRIAKEGIKAFVSLRQLSNYEARIGLLAGFEMGDMLMKEALYWAKIRHLSVLRITTQMSNIAAVRRYIASGANLETTAYWLYR